MQRTVTEMFMIMNAEYCESITWRQTAQEKLKQFGRICSFCETPLTKARARVERYCEHCPPPGAHHVRMTFRFSNGWDCSFWDADAGAMLSTQFTYQDATCLYKLAKRGRGLIGGNRVKQAFYHAIGTGQGALDLTLNGAEFQKLCAASRTATL